MSTPRFRLLLTVLLLPFAAGAVRADPAPASLTPPEAPAPRINGPGVFGVRPGSPFLYTIPATGERPMRFAATGLPAGLALDPATGRLTGVLPAAGRHEVMLHAVNARGEARRKFTLIAGPQIALTPALGWNSWNCWAESVDQEKVLRSARLLVTTGLSNHGWTYVNIDDTWQGRRTGPDHALQANEKFPDLAALCAQGNELREIRRRLERPPGRRLGRRAGPGSRLAPRPAQLRRGRRPPMGRVGL